jgi:hypothetical protein
MGSTKGRLWICRASAWNADNARVPQTHSLDGDEILYRRGEVLLIVF